MAFRLKLNEPVDKGFRRIGLEQITRAERQLEGATSGSATAIHETRKSLKRVRALLRLFRTGLGETTFRQENARFRDIGAMLSPARDSQVLIQTALKLETLPGQVSNAGLAAFKKMLQEDGAENPTVPDDVIAEALEKLLKSAKGFRRLKVGDGGFDIVEGGLKRSYGKALKNFNAAYASPHDEAFHDWRKTVQQHWRHMALVSRAWPEHFACRVAAARALSQLLGDDHDLAMLRVHLSTLPPARLPAMHVSEIERLVTARQQELRAEAAPRGKQLFVEGAKGHSHRVGEIWRAAQEMRSSPIDNRAPDTTSNHQTETATAN
jgi:CHAD domain-containing protein